MNDISAYVKDRKSAIFLLRHGHIDTADEKRYIGQTDISLSLLGIKQAEAWQHLLSKIPFTDILSSDLQRTRETARIIAVGRQQEIKIVPELNEINMGEWENLSFKEVMDNYPREFRERGHNPAGFRTPGGESFSDLQKRVLKVFLPLLSIQGYVLIVGHSGVNRVILCYLLGMPLDNLFAIEQDFSALNIIAAGTESHVLALNIKPY
ncbi:histidine phosphatase family protein [Chloroflexota bacterium]